MKAYNIAITEASKGYELLDCGDNEKLERFGNVVLSRPDPQALWKKRLSVEEWKKAQGQFSRDEQKADWTLSKDVPKKWDIEHGGLKFWIKPTAFKHTGLFPEQSTNWDWVRTQIEKRKNSGNNDIEVLNLFGYTGGATLACAQAGAKVVHIDSSKSAVTWARENVELSGLADKPIRWIVEDARIFVEREIKRGRKYDGIIMDPPAFGHSPTSVLWKIENDLLDLIEGCMQLLKDKPLFFLINGYSAGYSAIAYRNNLLSIQKKYGGEIETGELTIVEKEIPGQETRLLPAGIFARWNSV
ncbi:MAG: class I SAM-dependent methyltransferase [Candidatus Taylorbacteria bacterium]